jgi:hypothetical protein
MENFNLKKYLAEGRLLKEIDGDFGVNLNTPENAVKFKDFLTQMGIPAEVDGIFVNFDGSIDDMRKVSILRDKFVDTPQDSSPFKDERPIKWQHTPITLIKGYHVRHFSHDTESADLVWHRDRKDRDITPNRKNRLANTIRQ